MENLSYKIEIARTILKNAVNMNMRQELILKISQKTDEYVVEYLIKEEEHKKSES